MQLSIVIPVFRSEKILDELCRQLVFALDSSPMCERYEIILVNDCSPDGSWNVASRIAQLGQTIKAINLRKNVGQHGALLAGMRHSTGDVVVLMDDDLQHAPDDIELLTRALTGNVDVVYAEFVNKQHSWWKRWGSSFNDWCAARLIDKPHGLKLSSFKALRRSIVDEVTKYAGPFPYVDGLILAVTGSAINVSVTHRPRYEGRGNYGFLASIFLWTKMAMNFSVLPLRLASIAGMVLATFGLLAAAWVLTLRLVDSLGAEVPGWTSIFIAVLVIGGVQLMAIGAIGEYLGRAYMHLNGKPQYTIRDMAGFSSDG